MQYKQRSAIAPHVFAQVRSMKFSFKKLDRYRNTLICLVIPNLKESLSPIGSF